MASRWLKSSQGAWGHGDRLWGSTFSNRRRRNALPKKSAVAPTQNDSSAGGRVWLARPGSAGPSRVKGTIVGIPVPDFNFAIPQALIHLHRYPWFCSGQRCLAWPSMPCYLQWYLPGWRLQLIWYVIHSDIFLFFLPSVLLSLCTQHRRRARKTRKGSVTKE